MKNISNNAIYAEECTKCSTCGKPSWYILECDCGHIFCKYCSANEDVGSTDTLLRFECPKCGKLELYI